MSEDSSEEYIEGYVSSRLGVDAIFMKSQVTLNTERNHRYDLILIGVTEYYSYLLMLSEIYSRFKRCMHKVSPVFLNYNKKTERNLTMLLEAGLELNAIEECLSAVENGLNWSARKYMVFTRNRLTGIRSHVASFRNDVEKRRDWNDGELQVKNLIWMRRYSVTVFILVIVQITLSVLNVDWTKNGRNKNPIYINLFQEEKED